MVNRSSHCHCHVKHCALPPRVQGNNTLRATAWNYSYSGYCSPLSRGLPVQQGHMGSHQETADTDSEQAWPLFLLSFAKITISAGKSQGGDLFLYLIKAIQLLFLELYILASHNISFHLTTPAIHYPFKWNLAEFPVFKFIWTSSCICYWSRKHQLSSDLSLAWSFSFQTKIFV